MKTLLIAVFCFFSLSASADCAYPCKPITIIIPNGPGSASDVAARRIGESIKEHLHQDYQLDFIPGANGVVGTRKLLDSKPDGYTIMLSRAAIDVYNPVMRNNLGYDTLSDFSDIGVTFKFPMSVIVNPKSKNNTYSDLTRAAQLNAGSSTHGGILLIKRMSKHYRNDIVAAPYNTPDATRNNLAGQHLDFIVETVFPAINAHRQGLVQIVGVASHERLPALPNVPTLRELGYPVEQWGFLSLRGPRGMDPAVVAKLNDVLNRAMKERAYQAQLIADGMYTPANNRPSDLTKLIAGEYSAWDSVRQQEKINRE